MIRQSYALRNANLETTGLALARWASSFSTRSTGTRTSYQSLHHLRRLGNLSQHDNLRQKSLPLPSTSFPPGNFRHDRFSTSSKVFAISFRDLKSESKPSKPPKQEHASSATKKDASSGPDPLDPAEQAYQAAKRESDKEWAKIKEQARKEKERQEKEQAKPDSGEAEEEGKQNESREPPPPPPPHDNRSPWQVFTETLKSEFQRSKEWNESTKALSSSAHQFTENESVRKARAAYTAASGAATSTTASAIRGAGKTLGQGAAWTWDTSVVKGVRQGVNATGRAIDTATKPVRETKAFKSVKDVIDDGSSSRYGGWIEKEERRKQRELREIEEAAAGGRSGRRTEKMEEDPNAGTNITLHKDSKIKESWRNFKDNNKVMQSLFAMKSNYEESENPFISTARSITDRVAGFFAENESAMVIKKFREMDPTFQVEPFLREMREFILPEVLDAYVRGDTETLKLWLSAAQYQVYAALAQQYTAAGLKSDGRVLDIRHVDIASARMLEPGEIPVFIVQCRTQEVHVYRNAKTNELAAGMEDKVQLVTYAIGITRVPEDVSNPDTKGWRLIELQKSARDYI